MNYEVKSFRELRIAQGEIIKDVLSISVTFKDTDTTYEAVVEVPTIATDTEIEEAIIEKGKTLQSKTRNFNMSGSVI